MADKSDRVAANPHPHGADSGAQDHSIMHGAPAPSKGGTIQATLTNIEVDGYKWACDEGGLSSKFGKGAPGDKRGTSGESTVHVKAQRHF